MVCDKKITASVTLGRFFVIFSNLRTDDFLFLPPHYATPNTLMAIVEKCAVGVDHEDDTEDRGGRGQQRDLAVVALEEGIGHQGQRANQGNDQGQPDGGDAGRPGPGRPDRTAP